MCRCVHVKPVVLEAPDVHFELEDNEPGDSRGELDDCEALYLSSMRDDARTGI
jgi:hypothetical protein